MSQDYIASDYIRRTELPFIYQHHKEQRLRIFWVPVARSAYGMIELDALQSAVSTPEQPLYSLSVPEQDDLLIDLTVKTSEYLRELPVPYAERRSSAVYLSPIGEPELREAELRLRTELRDRHYLVLPERPLPMRWAEAQGIVRECLERADLMMAFIGSEYPLLAQGHTRRSMTLLELENEIANQLSVPRLFWVPGGMGRTDDVAELAEKVRNYGLSAGGYEWRESHLQSLIQDMERVLKAKRKQMLTAAHGEAPALYLICDQRDNPALNSDEYTSRVAILKSFIEEQEGGYAVFVPPRTKRRWLRQ